MQITNVEPLFVVELEVEGEKTYHSTKELLTSPFNAPIQDTILSFGALSMQARVDAFATVQTINLTFNDITGQFKYLLEHQNPYDCPANLYLMYRENKLNRIKPLVLGKLSTPFKWDEKERTFSCDLVSNAEYKEFGFSPSFSGIYEYLQSNLNSGAWPHLFGRKNYALTPMAKIPSTFLARNYVFLQPDELGAYPTFADTEETKFVRTTALTYLEIDPDSLGKMPAEGQGEFVSIVGPSGNILCFGQFAYTPFENGRFVIENFGTKPGFNLPIYHQQLDTGICCWSPRPYVQLDGGYANTALNYNPNILSMVGYGTYLPLGHNTQNELPAQYVVERPFITSPNPQLKGRYIKLRGHREWMDAAGQIQITRMEFLAKVFEQDGLNIYLTEVTDLFKRPIPSMGFVFDYIEYVIGNHTFLPFTHTPYPRPPIAYVQDANYSYNAEQYAVRLNNRSVVACPYWWPTRFCCVSLDNTTNVENVFNKREKRLFPLIAGADYNVVRFNEKDGWSAVYGLPTPDSYLFPGAIPNKFWHLVNNWDWEGEEDCPFCPPNATFVYLAPTLNEEESEIWVNAWNDINTDERAFNQILEWYSNYTSIIKDEQAYPINAVISKESSVTEVLGTLAFESFKMIRLDFDTCDLIPVDALLDQQTRLTMSERNIEKIDLDYDAVEDLINKYSITKEEWTGTGIYKDTASINKHGEHLKAHALTFQNTIEHLIKWLPIKANLGAKYILSTFPVILFTDKAVPNSSIKFDFKYPLNFLDAQQGNMIKRVPPVWEQCGGDLFNGVGYIEEVSIDPGSWQVNLQVKLPKIIGERMSNG